MGNQARNVARWTIDLMRAAVIVRVYQVLMVTLILAFGGSWVWQGIQAGVERDAEIANYQTGLDVFATQRTQRDTCLASVETRDVYRQRFIASAQTKDALIDVLADAFQAGEDNPFVIDLRQLVADELAAIDADLPPRRVEDCPPEPTPPEPPSHLKETS